MVKRMLLFIGFLISYVLLSSGCDSGMGPSSKPGIIRINLQSDPTDTTIIIVPKTYTASQVDSFGVTIFQGKVFNDSLFSILYKSIRATQQQDIDYNITSLENNQYKKLTIFESYVPAGEFNRIQFGLRANFLLLLSFISIKVETPEANRFIVLNHNFKVFENRITEINLQISPFQSVQRYRDMYQFIPKLKLMDIKYL